MKKQTAKKNDAVGQFGIVSWSTGYDVGKFVGLKRTRKEFRIRKLSKPKIINGVACPYFIEPVEVDCDTGEVTFLKKPWGLASTKEKAMETAKMFCESFNAEQIKLQKKGQDLEDQLRCKNSQDEMPPISTTDLEDVSKARQIMIRERFPSLFTLKEKHTGAPDTGFKEACRQAYILDLARLTGRVKDSIPYDSVEFAKLLATAIQNKWRRKPNTERNALIDAELARGWVCEGYCNLSPKDLALAMVKLFGGEFTAKGAHAIKWRRHRKLSLTSKRPEGAPIRST